MCILIGYWVLVLFGIFLLLDTSFSVPFSEGFRHFAGDAAAFNSDLNELRMEA